MKRSAKENRRYRLHVRIKKFTTINPKTKEVHVTDELMNGGSVTLPLILAELSEKYGYNIQYIIN